MHFDHWLDTEEAAAEAETIAEIEGNVVKVLASARAFAQVMRATPADEPALIAMGEDKESLVFRLEVHSATIQYFLLAAGPNAYLERLVAQCDVALRELAQESSCLTRIQ